jgi:hypothetical protein
LAVYSDIDWAGNREDRKSISEFVVTINIAAISQSPRKQSSMTTLLTEAEYMVPQTVVKEVISI